MMRFVMRVRVYPAAESRLEGVWRYTEERGGAEQAELYTRGLLLHLESIVDQPEIWRFHRDPRFKGIHFVRYQHHFLYFKVLGDGDLGLMTILHERMDIPRRLLDDLG
ncbi:MAG: type II toxin-antitoxin system RelE/ParE family toxin [Puniceicoccales bacterium]